MVVGAQLTHADYVLELASHGELAAQIRKFGSLDITATKYYAALLIDTIEFMHDRDIIHRDLKPENILLDDDMRIKVTDFGSAKILNRKDDKEQTSKRSFVGSADYVSPEVLRNEPASKAYVDGTRAWLTLPARTSGPSAWSCTTSLWASRRSAAQRNTSPFKRCSAGTCSSPTTLTRRLGLSSSYCST